MHFISPASLSNINWSIGYQDLIAVGQLFKTGKIDVERIISIAGPQVNNPAYFQTRLGACSDEITAGELTQRENRVISGSVISGREAIGPYAYLGRYHNQISVVSEPNSKLNFSALSLNLLSMHTDQRHQTVPYLSRYSNHGPFYNLPLRW